MNKYILGSFLAALAFFIWGFLYWAISPLPKKFIQTNPDEAAARTMLKQLFPTDGTYFIPNWSDDVEKMNDAHMAGPVATVHIKNAGADPMPPSFFVMGIVHSWVSTLLLTFLLVRASPAVLSGYWRRVRFVTLVGVAIAVISDFSFAIYWGNPWPIYLFNASFVITAMFVVGLVLAKFVKPADAA